MKNKLLKAFIATIVATTTLTSTAFANPISFTDVKQSDWYYSTVMKMANDGIINGTGDGSFNPAGQVSYAEFIKMLVC